MPDAKTRVLIVDDEYNQRMLLRNILLMEGYDVHCAANGSEALDMSTFFPAKVILSDLKMPGMDGIELLAKVMERHPGTIFIFITAYPNELDMERALRLGAKAVITKPIDIDELLKHISRNLGTHNHPPNFPPPVDDSANRPAKPL
jgi:CheY-like chemotaxis protein